APTRAIFLRAMGNSSSGVAERRRETAGVLPRIARPDKAPGNAAPLTPAPQVSAFPPGGCAERPGFRQPSHARDTSICTVRPPAAWYRANWRGEHSAESRRAAVEPRRYGLGGVARRQDCARPDSEAGR